ncbi:hypothetical protein HanPSC8_Chr08g0322151 [Helianthus annuus]|nr:hypothetical protein HanPSC8_Chr08g0322151 [Helianthus annuus]
MMWQNSNDRTCGIAHMQGLEKASFIRFFLILSHLSSFNSFNLSLSIFNLHLNETINSVWCIREVLKTLSLSQSSLALFRKP